MPPYLANKWHVQLEITGMKQFVVKFLQHLEGIQKRITSLTRPSEGKDSPMQSLQVMEPPASATSTCYVTFADLIAALHAMDY